MVPTSLKLYTPQEEKVKFKKINKEPAKRNKAIEDLTRIIVINFPGMIILGLRFYWSISYSFNLR
jgi:hypothetical protein